MLPHRYLVDYARRKGNVPFPCFYCVNRPMSDNIEMDEDGHIVGFGTDANVPITCTMGLKCPSEHDDCVGMQLLALPSDYRRTYPESLFAYFARDYYMELLVTIYGNGLITKDALIGRNRKGYHTRKRRINDLLNDGLIVKSYRVSGTEQYTLTEYGERIAESLQHMMDNVLLAMEEGELMDDPDVRHVFEWIRDNPDSTKRQIYDCFEELEKIELIMDKLEDQQYVEPLFDKNNVIVYNSTERGLMVWNAIRGEASSVRGAEE